MALVILDFDGNLQEDINVILEIRTDDPSLAVQTRIKGKLPPNLELEQFYQKWRSHYHRLDSGYRLEDRSNNSFSSFSDSPKEALQLATKNLVQQFNEWLKTDSFRPIYEKLLESLSPQEEIRVILQIDTVILRKLPWHSWDFLKRYPQAEIALSASAYERPDFPPLKRTNLRILAILGHSQGIDVEADQAILQEIPYAELTLLVEPKRDDLYQQLWDAQGWDILFFAGHSSSYLDGENGCLEINGQDKIYLHELSHALKKAVKQGLKIAIFNSCDGLGLARQLEHLHIPHTIVMREPIPDLVATAFLKSFLNAFCQQTSLYLSVREAREKLQVLENDYPCASELPIIFQNPTTLPFNWQPFAQFREPVENLPCPYRGLSPFYADHADYFFGRDAVIEKLVYAVYTKPLITLIGPSGSGKSSVIFAGLLPKFKHDALIVQFRPSQRPFFQLSTALVSCLDPQLSETEQLREVNQLSTALRQQEVTLQDICDLIWQKFPNKRRFLLVLDQLEEIYTLCPDRKIQENFLKTLLQPVEKKDRTIKSYSLTLILTLRADFLQYALSDRTLANALCNHNPDFLQPMTPGELLDTITQPAEKLGIAIAPGLATRILEAIGNDPGNLPLLEFALTLLWERQEGGCLTHNAYQHIGGVKQALASHAEQVYQTLTLPQQKQTRRLFLQLVHPGEGTADTRRLATREQLYAIENSLIDQWVQSRLVRVDQDHLELVHEALIQAWDRLQHWLEDDRTFRMWQERLRGTMRQWEKAAKEEGHLLQGTPLLEAQRWLTEREEDLAVTEKDYIQASVLYQSKAERLRQSLQKQLIWVLATGFIVSFFLAILAFWQWHRANVGEVGVHLSSLSLSSEQLFASKKELEALLTSIRAAKQVSASRELQPAMKMRAIAALQQTVYGIREYNHLEDHERTVIDVAFSPNGEYLASASDDQSVKLWQKDGKLLHTLVGHKDLVRHIAWSPNSDYFASASYDQTVQVWDTEGKLLRTLQGLETQLNSVAIDPNSDRIVAAGMDGSLQLWEKDGTLIKSWRGHQTGLEDVVFSPDGEILASGGSDHLIKLWDRQGQLLATLKGHTDTVTRLAFSPDSQSLASVSKDGTVRLWQRNGQLIHSWPAHENIVWGVSFSPDGTLLATASADQTIKLWQLDGTLVTTFAGHNASVYTVDFSPDAIALATASADTTIKLWHPYPRPLPLMNYDQPLQSLDFGPQGKQLIIGTREGQIMQTKGLGLHAKTLIPHPGFLYGLRWSPEGSLVVSVGLEGQVFLQTPQGKKLKQWSANQGALLGVDISPDGRWIVTGGEDGTVKLWTREGKLVQTLQGHQQAVFTVRWSGDGLLLATGGEDDLVRVWSWESDRFLPQSIALKGHSSRIDQIVWSPDHQTLASASHDGTVKLWSIPSFSDYRRESSNNTQDLLRYTLRGHVSKVQTVAFSPDGQILASGSSDGAVKLWSLQGTLLTSLQAHEEGVTALQFHPYGKQLVSASLDQRAIFWNLDLQDLLEKGCQWMEDYLKTSPSVGKRDRNLCQI